MPRLLPLTVLLALMLPAAARAEDGAWRVVTFDGAVASADRAALDGAGAREVQASGARRYVAWLEDGAARRIRAFASIRPLRPAEKLDSALRARGLATVVRLVRGRRASRLEVLHRRRAQQLALRPDVLYVGPASAGLLAEDEATDQIVAGNLKDGLPVVGYTDWLSGIGLDGAGVRISVVDTGIDHRHPDLASRVVEKVSNDGTGHELDDLGHGTHVAGIVAGVAAPLPGGVEITDLDGFRYGLGMAPGSDLIDQNAIGLTAGGPLGEGQPREILPKIAADAVRAGAVAWNASWHTGEGTGIGYVENSRVLDTLVRDADPEKAGAQPLTMVFSAGNAGSGETTVTSPKEAKNIITVASSVSSRNGGNPDGISDFSSRGPARDGRFLPTVTAPGENVVSAHPLVGGQICLTGGKTTDGVTPYHTRCSGTSMAAPHVAGAVSLLVQWWRRAHGGADPSPAMTQALLVNSAADMGDPDVPNGDEGWGRVDLGALFGRTGDRVLADQDHLITEPGEQRALHVEPVDPSLPMRATVVWSDAPGTPAADDDAKERPALVNDLDLAVVAPDGTAYHGNNFQNGASVAGGAPDRLNNVENVWLPAPAAGAHAVTVTAAAVPGDGDPSRGDTTDQDYALVLSNARPVAAPEPAGVAAPQSGRVPVQARWRLRGRRTVLRRLRLRDVTAGTVVRLDCRGRGCPPRALRRKVAADRAALDLTRFLRGRRLAPRSIVTLRIATAPGAEQRIRWTVRRGRAPARRATGPRRG